jgi:hypothetical protein
MQKITLYFIFLVSLFSCTKEITIDLEDGEQMIGIYGSITTEKKKHAIKISRSAGFYSSGAPEMVSNATVSIFDGTTTIRFAENPEQPGIYETVEEVAGKVGFTYQLSVSLQDKDGEMRYFSAESSIRQIPGRIDSAQLLPQSFNGRIIEERFKICPFFQTVADRDMIYLTKVAINDVLITDTLTESSVMQLAELNGIYFNGVEMQALFEETGFPVGVYTLNTKRPDENIHPYDKITIYLYSIDEEYRQFLQDVRSSGGSNPFMGTPVNVRSNIQPAGKVLGFFHAESMVEYSFLYDE